MRIVKVEQIYLSQNEIQEDIFIKIIMSSGVMNVTQKLQQNLTI